MAYFCISQYYRPVPELDNWIRRRIRMCYSRPHHAPCEHMNLFRIAAYTKKPVPSLTNSAKSLATQKPVPAALNSVKDKDVTLKTATNLAKHQFRPSWSLPWNNQTGRDGGMRPIAARFSSLSDANEKARQEAIRELLDQQDPHASVHSISAELNGAVQVTSTDDTDETVVCRHFAYHFLAWPGDMKELMERYSTRRGIKALFDGKLTELDDFFNCAIREAKADSKHLLRSDDFGRYMASLAQALETAHEQGRPVSQANCLVLTQDHAMALLLRRRVKNNVTHYIAKLYDPNDTASYKRVVALTPERLARRKLEEMMISPHFADEYAGSQGLPMPLVAVCLDPELRPPMIRDEPAGSVAEMHMALRCGVANEVQATLAATKTRSPSAQPSFFQLLQARSAVNEAPGLNIAFSNDYSEAVSVFTNFVLSADQLTEADKISLLAARRADNTPGLYLAFNYAATDSIKAFVEPILSTETLSVASKTELLLAKNVHGICGLSSAVILAEPKAIQAFVEPILRSNLPEKAKFRVLNAASSEGTPSLNMAFGWGSTPMIKVFTELIVESPHLSEPAKVKLLRAESRLGVSGLARARISRQHEACSAFIDLINSSKLSQGSKEELTFEHMPARSPS